MADQPLPMDLEAEGSVLSECMADESGITYDSVREVISDTDFYADSNKWIFEAMGELREASAPITLINVSSRLRDKQRFNHRYFESIVHAQPSAANVLGHARIIKEKSRLRKLIAAATTLRAQAYGDLGPDGTQGFLERAEIELGEIAHQGESKHLRPFKSLMQMVLDAATAAKERGSAIVGIPTGMELDQLTSGLQDGDLRIVAARPGVGKSSYVLDEATRLAERGYAVPFFSLEMPELQLGFRAAASHARIDLNNIRSGHLSEDDWKELTTTAHHLGQLPIWVDDTPSLSIQQLRARTRRLVAEVAAGKHPTATQGRLGSIYVDYLQLMDSPMSGNRYASRENLVSAISRALKALAKELNLPVTVVASLNRETERRSDKRPILSDLRESGSIESDADTVVFLYRDDMYDEASTTRGTVELIVAKQRNGPTGKVTMKFTGKHTRFDNLATGVDYVEDFFDKDRDGG